MKYLLLLYILGFMACTNIGNNKTNTVTISKPDTCKYEHLDKHCLIGYFNHDKILDTLYQININKVTKNSIDSFPANLEWDTLINYFYKNNSENIITTSVPAIDSLYLGTGIGLYCLLNLGDINKDKQDEIALVVNYCDYSNLNSCKIFTLCGNQFKQLKSFQINESAFDYINNKPPSKFEIKEFLEQKNGKWHFLDYLKDLEADKKSLGKMNVLKLRKCN